MGQMVIFCSRRASVRNRPFEGCSSGSCVARLVRALAASCHVGKVQGHILQTLSGRDVHALKHF